MKEEDWKENLEDGVYRFGRILRRLICDVLAMAGVFMIGYFGAQMYMDTHGLHPRSRVTVIRPSRERTFKVEPIGPKHFHSKSKTDRFIPQAYCPSF